MSSVLDVPPSVSRLLPLLVLACAPVEESQPPAAVRPLSAEVATTPPAVEWIWADGPVAWGEWSDANLARAQREDRPLLVYFAAPGCEGLFPDPTPALRQLVEEVFVGVRVDPFARPDIARHYDAGGWPALVAALLPLGVAACELLTASPFPAYFTAIRAITDVTSLIADVIEDRPRARYDITVVRMPGGAKRLAMLVTPLLDDIEARGG